MGGCISVQVDLSCKDVVRQMSDCLCGDKNFVVCLQKNVHSLKSDMEELCALREDLLRRIRVEEMKGLRRCAEVRLWLSKVRAVVSRVERKLEHAEAEIQKLCFCGYCSKSYCLSYSYGVEVWSLLGEVQTLYSKGRSYTVLAEEYVITKVEGIPIDPSISRSKIASTWNILVEDRVGCLGLFGIPGVGKTTLLSQINNEFLIKEHDFDVVIFVEVRKDQTIPKIQEAIGRRLELYDVEWIQKAENVKALDIRMHLRNKRYALLLDNMLVKVDVIKLGVPLPDADNRSKIVFTTLHREVCLDMGVDEAMDVTRLDSYEAWVLFREQVGEDILRSDSSITPLARIICEKCCGLPIVINAIAQTMARKTTLKDWQDAITKLGKKDSSLAEFSSEEDEIIAILKFSYNNLEDHEVKRCFRYFALFPENNEMRKDQIIEYWECEDLTERGDLVFDKLVRACLLMEHEGKVKMHGIVRQMALLEDADIGEPKGSIVVETDAKLIQIPSDLEWKMLKKMSLVDNQIKEISGSPSCPSLTTLLLSNQKVENISTDFFLQMSSLLVLDLSQNRSLTHLPANISKLVSLRYLNLSSTNIELLPVGLKELKQLICLDLEHTNMLQNIVGISSLLNLKVLRLLGSKFRATVNFVEELKRLECTNMLTITLSDEAAMRSFFGCQKLASHTQSMYIEDVATEADGISFVTTSSSVQYLVVLNSNINLLSHQRNPTAEPFGKLYEVKLYDCRGSKHLTWLLFAPNLNILHVVRVKDIEEILSKEIAEGELNVQAGITPFENLKSFEFEGLEELTSIYWSALPFKSLSKIFVRQCPKLKKLPLNSESAKECNLVIDAESHWIKRLDWVNEETKDRFCPN